MRTRVYITEYRNRVCRYQVSKSLSLYIYKHKFCGDYQTLEVRLIFSDSDCSVTHTPTVLTDSGLEINIRMCGDVPSVPTVHLQ